jgi:hypothetical protein
VQAKKTLGEDAAIEIGTDFAFDEASNGRSLLARVGEECLEALSDDFVKKRLLRLVALVVGQVDPVRDRVGVEIKCRRIASVGGGACKQPPFPSRCGLSEAGGHSGGESRAGRGGISFAITASLPQARSGAALLFATARSLVESRPPHACGEIWVACLAIRLAAFDTPGIIPNAQLEGRSLSCRVIDV